MTLHCRLYSLWFSVGPLVGMSAQWRLLMGLTCSVKTVGRMFLGFPCQVKTVRSVLLGQD